ncbi:hypothetical protein MIND_01250000 [Mycena indigotica]|uniref:Uncharacterized protein n=1 Tax=Mycena indigotica TaxID=2126181 RepID=A0A8H6S542_9AGAR|nr:uncharacterized protein MIND_01250000 [Mycena indigotica]KAF7292226.1 hypothetical protein MIND_01250000 [Mycena indigotica]
MEANAPIPDIEAGELVVEGELVAQQPASETPGLPNAELESPATMPNMIPTAQPSSQPPTLVLQPPTPAVTATGRPQRTIRLPGHYREELPTNLAPADNLPATALRQPEPVPQRRVHLIVRDTFRTAVNKFGLWRSYLHRPTYDPDTLLGLDDLCNYFAPANEAGGFPHQPANLPVPPINRLNTSASLLLLDWQNNGHTTKSSAQLDSLVSEVLLHPEFNTADLRGFKAVQAEREVEKAAEEAFPLLKQFQQASVDIEIPSGSTTIPPQRVAVPGLWYRSLTSIVRAAFSDPLSRHFHFSPFKSFHRVPSTGEDVRVFSELYNSDAFIDEHDKIRQRGELPPDALDCTLEKTVAALMFWSDSTHLANFGTAKLWPIYLLFGNLSKFFRDKPGFGAEHHVAYIPSLPDSVQDFISQFHVKWQTQKDDIMTHCRRELFHAVWKFLLDDEFLHAYRYGIVIRCADGVERRVYPRIFMYSADYPEKILLATIRPGLCPCPRCLIPKTEMHLMGFVRDISVRLGANIRTYLRSAVSNARDKIYRLANGIGSNMVEALLKPTSSVATKNAFIERLGDDFDLHRMLVVDFMHEFELGVWKNLFTHLIRLLHAQQNGVELVAELNKRYRSLATFGLDTIRRFPNNASEMKKLGARDFEDLLQCAIPVFDGLFPAEDNARVLKLLFRLGEWHSFTKLRMHTDPTLEHLRVLTPEIGRLMRDFKRTTCTRFATYELPHEASARDRKSARDAAKRTAAGTEAPPSQDATGTRKRSKKRKALNLNTYKYHAMPDYPSTIRLFSTTDVFSTRLGESLHRLVKRLYSVTSKRDHESQIAKRVLRLERARWSQAVDYYKARSQPRAIPNKRNTAPRRMKRTELVFADPFGAKALEVHHCISLSRRRPLSLYKDFSPKGGDPAKKFFIPHLQDHILARLLNLPFDGDANHTFSDAERRTVDIQGDKIYVNKLFRVNYTTYDVRRDQDVMNSSALPFVMVNSPNAHQRGAHPYWYAQVLGILNATVSRVTATDRTRPVRMEFLWVRWLGDQPGYTSGLREGRLPVMGFVPDTDPYAFGFLDPEHVVRGAHLMPVFRRGRTSELLQTKSTTAARFPNETSDWEAFYVGIFVDRDMVMRYVGGGIGHLDAGHGELTVEDQEDDPNESVEGIAENSDSDDNISGSDSDESRESDYDSDEKMADFNEEEESDSEMEVDS